MKSTLTSFKEEDKDRDKEAEMDERRNADSLPSIPLSLLQPLEYMGETRIDQSEEVFFLETIEQNCEQQDYVFNDEGFCETESGTDFAGIPLIELEEDELDNDSNLKVSFVQQFNENFISEVELQQVENGHFDPVDAVANLTGTKTDLVLIMDQQDTASLSLMKVLEEPENSLDASNFGSLENNSFLLNITSSSSSLPSVLNNAHTDSQQAMLLLSRDDPSSGVKGAKCSFLTLPPAMLEAKPVVVAPVDQQEREKESNAADFLDESADSSPKAKLTDWFDWHAFPSLKMPTSNQDFNATCELADFTALNFDYDLNVSESSTNLSSVAHDFESNPAAMLTLNAMSQKFNNSTTITAASNSLDLQNDTFISRLEPTKQTGRGKVTSSSVDSFQAHDESSKRVCQYVHDHNHDSVPTLLNYAHAAFCSTGNNLDPSIEPLAVSSTFFSPFLPASSSSLSTSPTPSSSIPNSSTVKKRAGRKPLPTDNVDKMEEAKILLRRERNKIAANKCRHRRKQDIEEIQMREQQLAKENCTLRENLAILTKHLQALRNIICSHPFFANQLHKAVDKLEEKDKSGEDS